jgi:hypothetical protein
VLPIPTDPTILFKFDVNFKLLLCNMGLPGVNPETSDEVKLFPSPINVDFEIQSIGFGLKVTI